MINIQVPKINVYSIIEKLELLCKLGFGDWNFLALVS
jgi:hypothetical protein